MTSTRRRAFSVFVAVLAAAALGAGCGDDDDDAADSETTTTVAEEEPEGESIEVTAVDYAFEGLPETVDTGVAITLNNTSEAELHEFVAFRLADDETRTIDELVALPEAELEALFAGEPAMVLLDAPGEEDPITAVGDGTFTEPGRYVIFCAIPQGADPEAYMNAPLSDGPPEVEGGPPHFTLGMYGEVTVE